MTHLILTLNNYLTSPIEFILRGLGKLYKSIECAQIRRATEFVRRKMWAHKVYRDTYNQLSALTDKELNDIGISRGMIHSVAMEAYFDGQVETNPNLRNWV